MLGLLLLIAAVGIAANMLLDMLARVLAPWSAAQGRPKRA